MKPSERVKEIFEEKLKKDPHNTMLGVHAICQYLDEQWELKKTPEQRQVELY